MTEIYLIRHTQAEGNLYRIMQGHWDGDVTVLGRKEVAALAERFKDVHIDALYSSDLYRARYTASAITKYHDLPLITTPGLREINMGVWEARAFGDVIHEDINVMLAFLKEPDKWQVEGSENFEDVTRRTLSELERIAAENDGKTIAVVSHGVAIRCMLARITGKGYNDKDAPICNNTGINHIFYENGVFTADYINDTKHLDSLDIPEWDRPRELWAESMDPMAEKDFYTACYSDAWQFSHKTLRGFRPEPYLRAACDHYRKDSGAVLKMYDGDKPVGLVDIDPDRGSQAGYGWISLIYLVPEYRRTGCGPQLLGRAVVYFKKQGRKALRLYVAEENSEARGFYERMGFELLSYEDGSLGRLCLMELKFGGGNV